MTIWRPRQGIQVKAIGLLWKGSRLLAADVHDDSGAVKGVRPLGGSVEFGETWQTALQREFVEELGVRIEIAGSPIVMENIYHHEGEVGHEIIFAANVALANPSSLPDADITFTEDNGTLCTARWHHPENLGRATGPDLYPIGLKKHLGTI